MMPQSLLSIGLPSRPPSSDMREEGRIGRPNWAESGRGPMASSARAQHHQLASLGRKVQKHKVVSVDLTIWCQTIPYVIKALT